MSGWHLIAFWSGSGLLAAIAIHAVGNWLAPFDRPAHATRASDLAILAVLAAGAPAISATSHSPIDLVGQAVFTWGCLAAFYWDVTRMRVPRAFSACFALTGFTAGCFVSPGAWWIAASGALFALAFLYGAAHAFRNARGQAGIGGGDPALFAALAVWLGPRMAFVCLVGGVPIAFCLAGLRPDFRMPLASGLAASALIVAVVGRLLGEPVLWAWEL